MSRWVACAAIVLGLVSGPLAHAGEQENVSKAREIALSASDDLDAKRFAEALEKVTQAEALYHAPTHLLMRAEALEGLGRLAEALETYERLAAEPLGPTSPPAFRKAREEGSKRERALLARVPSLLVVVTGAATEDVKATVDDKPLALGTGMATRFDPGKHVLRVEASGFSPVERTIELDERGGVIKVPVHLEVASARPVRDEKVDVIAPKPAPSGRTLFVPAMAAFGVGAASLVAGAVTGVMSLGRVGELEELCTSEGRCPPSAQGHIDEAGTLGNVSTAMFVVGGAAAAAGVVLLVMGKPKGPPAVGHVEVVPWAGPLSAGIRGTF
ncbi:PEGA domain-containing protein [Polyangium sorediatum]|uniref:PEGA domain-containing protein n=1 Tax=Polyangium sorediatum TaxID=889274 RepID=A0ABT6NR19_9BACT|nr:PEGA domain-containing protein [Polyangium sorediatum]MDI1430777.1 PEGA domain-containing protein [Polyangium sorediatum]